jgi:hypothetical protein
VLDKTAESDSMLEEIASDGDEKNNEEDETMEGKKIILKFILTLIIYF